MKHLGTIKPKIAVAVLVSTGVIAAFYGPMAAIITFVCMAIAVCLFAGWLLFHVVILRKSDKSFILSALHSADVLHQAQVDLQRKGQHDFWCTQVGLEEVTIQSHDDLELHATVVQNGADSHRWMVVCHGYAQAGNERLMFIVQTFHEMGYWVLVPDARGHGKSGGDYLGMGWLDRTDVLQWIHEIGTRNNTSDIVLYGISMGAATILMTAGEPLPLTVKAIVADCGYTSAVKECTYQLKTVYCLPAFPIILVSSLITRIRAGYWLGEASALRQIAKSKTPILLIHGTADTFVPCSMLEELFDAAVCPKQKMLVEGAGHGQSPIVDRTRYWQTISDFLGMYESKNRF